MADRARILIAASAASTAAHLKDALAFCGREVDVVCGTELPESHVPYKLLVCALGAKLTTADDHLTRLRNDAHVILIDPHLDIARCAQHFRDPHVNHVIGPDASIEEIQTIVEKLETGAIFGLERYLSDDVDVRFRRLASFESRRKVLDEMDEYLAESGFRRRLRQAASAVTEELLMNAMYQAPVDASGYRIFSQVDPRKRIKRKSPLPVSVRYCSAQRVFFLCVRDRYGSFSRRDLSERLIHCVNAEEQIDNKTSGAGLGLYLVVSRVSRCIINVLPQRVTELICAFEDRPSSCAQVLSVTTQVPLALSSNSVEPSEPRLE